MKRVMIRYTVKPEAAEDNADLVRAVYEELDGEEPSTLRYATFVLDDGVTFVHIAEDDAPEGEGTLTGIAAFRRFREGLSERCTIPPVASELSAIGTYRLFG